MSGDVSAIPTAEPEAQNAEQRIRHANHPGQTYEGGISGQPDSEAHGAYAFCALACLALLDDPRRIIPKYVPAQSKQNPKGGNGRGTIVPSANPLYSQ
jgi:prenyltransferase beta subunit